MKKNATKAKKIDRKRGVQTDAVLESISDGVFTVDHDWRVTSFNRAAEEITGVPREDALGKRCSEVFRASMCEIDCALRQTLKTGKPVINRPGFIIDVDGRRIPISLSTALLRNEKGQITGGAETFRDLSEVEELRREITGRFQIGDLISRSPLMKKIFNILPAVAASDSTVLILGETGTGKELLARAIHDLSMRRNNPFIAVNSGALPDTLLESELFGYKQGAFTGADQDKPGRFVLAEGGSLFLDEIGEVSPALQVRLLRVLQERVVEPLGGTKAIPTDIRLITATNKNLQEELEKGHFRQDLYYRINVVEIALPPLRKRKEDIPLLADHFIERFNRQQEKTVSGLRPEVLTALMGYHWPGNIRELENVIEHAFVLCSTGLIESQHLPAGFTVPGKIVKKSSGLEANLKAMEGQIILEALERNQYNRVAAARDLKIHKSTFFRKLKALGISLPDNKDGRSRKQEE